LPEQPAQGGTSIRQWIGVEHGKLAVAGIRVILSGLIARKIRLWGFCAFWKNL
jgi:hypothetical protein